MSRAIDRGFSVALAASQLSDAPRAGLRMGSALFSGPRLLSIGANVYARSHPGSDNGPDFVRSTHAEAQALCRRRYYQAGGGVLTLYVARRRADGSQGCSKPCPNCLNLCKLAGVRRVRYFDAEGLTQELAL